MMFSRYLGLSHRLMQTTLAPTGMAAPAALHECDYALELASSYFSRADILAIWHQMLEKAESPELVYQSPQFFSYLNEKETSGEKCELFIARRRIDQKIVGFVPVRTADYTLHFGLGSRSLCRRSFRVCQVLGSVPLLDAAQKGLTAFVFQQLLAHYPDCKALHLQSVPEAYWRELTGVERLSSHVAGGWRACHTQPLPESVDAYLKKFSAKKRYNLLRQARLLEEAAGRLQVVRIEEAAQVASLLEALRALSPGHAALRDTDGTRHRVMARHGMLLSYVIRCGDENVAVVYGTRSSTVWHVYNIVFQQQYRHVSPGSTALHLAVQDVLASEALKLIDFGYGTPNADFRSTHLLTMRGRIFLYRPYSPTVLLFKLHALWDKTSEALVCRVKQLQKWFAARKQ